jgi:fructokinase
MQIGIDVGATKIESVVLEEDGNEKHRSRTECPKDYLSISKLQLKIFIVI